MTMMTGTECACGGDERTAQEDVVSVSEECERARVRRRSVKQIEFDEFPLY